MEDINETMGQIILLHMLNIKSDTQGKFSNVEDDPIALQINIEVEIKRYGLVKVKRAAIKGFVTNNELKNTVDLIIDIKNKFFHIHKYRLEKNMIVGIGNFGHEALFIYERLRNPSSILNIDEDLKTACDIFRAKMKEYYSEDNVKHFIYLFSSCEKVCAEIFYDFKESKLRNFYDNGLF